MNKALAIQMFGTVRALAAALGVTTSAIYQWPDVLPQRTADEVRGAALRLGKFPRHDANDAEKETVAA